MSTSTAVDPRRAFALVELAAGLIVAALLLSVLLAVGARARQADLRVRDLSKLRELGAATAAYAAEYDGRLWALSWKGGVQYNSQWPELNFAATDFQAQVHQTIEILRRHANRPEMYVPSGWIPHPRYSHLVLADYLSAPMPWFAAISRGDEDHMRWASDPECYDHGCFLPCQPHPGGKMMKYPYRASFQLPPAFWDQSEVGSRVSQGGTAYTYFTPSTARLGPGHLSDVAHPSSKVHLHDGDDRYTAPSTTFTFNHPGASLPLLFMDASASVRPTLRANPGWQPNQPQSPSPTMFLTEIVTGTCIPGGATTYQVTPSVNAPGVYRWTRGGLAGRDYNGNEVWPRELPAPAAAASETTAVFLSKAADD